MTARILVIGTTGQLARALFRHDAPAGFELVGVGREQLDLADPRGAFDIFASIAPALIVNAAAYTAVDKAESEPRLAYAANAVGAGLVAKAAAAQGIGFIHISTDYVFDGAKPEPWVEDDPVGPLGVYGASKLAGEITVAAAHPRAVIIRTSWVVSPTGHNFVRTMLRLGSSRPEVKVVNDQLGKPTTAASLAHAILSAVPAIVDDVGTGAIYHFSNDGPVTSWHGFAEVIFEAATRHGGKRPIVTPIPTTDYPTPARRPANSALATAKFEATFDYRPFDWREALDEVIGELAVAGEV